MQRPNANTFFDYLNNLVDGIGSGRTQSRFLQCELIIQLLFLMVCKVQQTLLTVVFKKFCFPAS